MATWTCKRILLVDDDESVLRTVKELLGLHGYQVDPVDSPLQALKLMSRNSYAAVISDIKMPEMSGLELLVAIHEVNQDIPVVLMSGHADLDMAIDAVKKGAFDFIIKPYKHEQLINTAERAVAAFSHIQEEIRALTLLEETVSQSAQDWENTFNTITDMITIHDKDYNIIFANTAARESLQLSSFLPGKTKCCTQYHGTDTPPPGCPSCASLKTGKPVNFETFEPHLNKYLEFRAIPRINSSNEVIGMIHIVRDITDRKQAEEELLDAQRVALESSRVKSEFLANMSHEIRTPMNGVIGMLDLLLHTEISDRQRDYVSMCRSSADAMLHLLNDILDVSKMESGRIELDRSDFSLRQTLKASLGPQLAVLRNKGLSFLCTVPSTVPDLLVGDAGRLMQIFTNLVDNAVKFTQHGGIELTVTADARDNDSVVLHGTVHDSGIGIPTDRLIAVFEPFRQVDSSTTRKYGGTGLGLSIAKGLAEMMGGRITVESEVGKGSTFHVVVHAGVRQATSLPPVEWVTWSVGSEVRRNDGPWEDKSDDSEVSGYIHKLHNAVVLRNDVLIEEYAQKLKDCAAAAQFNTLSDNAFRIQLAVRKGDLERAATIFEQLNAEWTRHEKGRRSEECANAHRGEVHLILED